MRLSGPRSRVAAQLAASRERLSSMKLVGHKVLNTLYTLYVWIHTPKITLENGIRLYVQYDIC
jgi:hypothetical protein